MNSGCSTSQLLTLWSSSKHCLPFNRMNRDISGQGQSNDEDLVAEVHGFLSVYCGISDRTSLQLTFYLLKKGYRNLVKIRKCGRNATFRKLVDKFFLTQLQETEQEIATFWEMFQRGLTAQFQAFANDELDDLKKSVDRNLQQAFMEKKIEFLKTLSKNCCMLAAAYLSILQVEAKAKNAKYYVPRALVWLKANQDKYFARICLEKFADLGLNNDQVVGDTFSQQSGIVPISAFIILNFF